MIAKAGGKILGLRWDEVSPFVVVCDSRTGESKVVRSFGYEDYKSRLS